MSHNHSVKENTAQIFGIAVLGAFIGAGVAMLFAPKTGTDARSELKNKVKSMKAKTQEYKTEISEAADNAEGIALKAKQDAKQEVLKEEQQKAKAKNKNTDTET